MRLLGALLAIAVITAACDKAQLLAPTNSTISVSAASRTLALGGSTEITAVVIEQAGTQVQNGTTVRFTTSLGRVDPVEAQTRNGVATTTFFAGDTSGLAEVRALSGGAGAGASTSTTTTTTGGTGTASAGNVVQITVGAAAANTVTVSASPGTIGSFGGTSTITALVFDASGNRLTNVPVSFSTTAGSLSASAVNTDANGEANVTLTTDRTATVTAASGGKSATVAVTAATANSLSITLAPNPGTVGNAVTATVTPTIGANNAPPRVTINWGDGSSAQDLGTLAGSRTVTHVYATTGVFTVTGQATTGTETAETSVAETINPAGGVSVSANPTSGTTATSFSFTITPATNGVTPQNVSVDFGDGTSALSLGAITSSTTVTHTYSSTGTKSVVVTQTNTNGGTSTGAVVVTVS
ncbi:MAG TPA: Ig-like domain-containing protein [Vicinamibacterales bacterium]|jgi:hypothetical protein|nr:Ig-like domain-containing protein [Vicinamibacterales bacterium]